MGNHWFVYRNQKQKGPYTWEQLWREAQAGRIRPKDLVWNKTMKDWIQASQVPGLIINIRKRNYLTIAVAVSAAFFFVLSGTAFYYLFFYTGPQLAILEEQEENEWLEGALEEEPGEPEPAGLNENRGNEDLNRDRNNETASAPDPDHSADNEEPSEEPGEQTVSFQGGTYTGPLKEGEPHGYGIWEHPDGRRYEGDFSSGRIEGYGTMTFPGGERYTGFLKDGKAHGEGTMIHPDGRQVSGQWVEGLLQRENDEDNNDDDESANGDDDNNNNET